MTLMSITLLLATSALVQGASPLRLRINGSRIIDPTTGTDVILRGFNWYVPYAKTDNSSSVDGDDLDDGTLLHTLLPGATVVRVVGVFWDNWVGSGASKDCRTSDASQGYIKPSCVEQLDSIVRIAAARGIWVILTGRAEYAAGQDPSMPTVFNNATLRAQYYAMWQFLAEHYRDFDRIAAYEIMSEPRTKTDPDQTVADFMSGGCLAVHKFDPATPCMVGPAPYYKPWKLSDTYILKDQPNTIYTFDFFQPAAYVMESFNGPYKYPDVYPCDVAYKGWTDVFCPQNRSELFMVNKTWMENLFAQYPGAIREKYNVPVLANQFGANRAVGDDHGRAKYLNDILAFFKEQRIHHIYWLWRWDGKSGGGDHWGGYELIHHWAANGTVDRDYETLDIFNASWTLE